ncbi:MAG: hypothetical protein AAF403_03790, partial [Pseudomonadota bacterium]
MEKTIQLLPNFAENHQLNLLLFDLSTKNMVLALRYQGQIKRFDQQMGGNDFAAQFPELLDHLTHHIDEKELHAIIVNCGPGSFTGLRVSLACAYGLSEIWQKPVILLNGFEMMCYQVY